MRSRIMSSCLTILGAIFIPTLANGQGTKADGPELKERRLAVNLVRAVNTAEMAYRDRSGGSFAEWADISSSQELSNVLSRLSVGEPKVKNANLSSPDQILPGWRLKLMVSRDGKSYTVLLISTLDQCSYALVSDQEGTIREGSAIGCSGSKQS